jgi:hypothetical protein
MKPILLSLPLALVAGAVAGEFDLPSPRAALEAARANASEPRELRAAAVEAPPLVVVAVDFREYDGPPAGKDIAEVRVYKFKKAPGVNSLRLREIALDLGVPYGELARRVRAARPEAAKREAAEKETWHGSEHEQIWNRPGARPPKTHYDDTLH